MNIESKQRIVGIIVLVAFVILLIPFLFTSSAKKNPGAKPATAADISSEVKIPEITKPVVITPAPAAAVPQQPQQTNIVMPQAAAPIPAPIERPQLPEPEAGLLPPDDQVPPTGMPPKMAAETIPATPPGIIPAQQQQPIATQQPVVIQQPVVAPQPQKITPIVTGTPVVAPVVSKATVPVKATNSIKATKPTWSVQMGCFAEQKRVKQLIKELSAKGYHVYVQKRPLKNGPTLTCVLVNREPTKEKAQAVAKHIQTSFKLVGSVVRSGK